MKYTLVSLAFAAAALAAPAHATDFSFTGTFNQDDDVAFFDFTATGASTVTLRSFSYAGGINAAGATISAGGFDPILSLYNIGTGALVAYQDDGSGVPADPVTRAIFDVNFMATLTAGNYRVALSQYNNFGGTTLTSPFTRAGTGNFTSSFCTGAATAPFCDVTGAKRNSNWAFDILGVSTAVGPGPVTSAVPEPASWAMMIVGFGAVGFAMRSAKRRSDVKFDMKIKRLAAGLEA